jgi:hypothetical protein
MKGLILWTWRQIVKLGFWSCFCDKTFKIGSANVADNMVVTFKVTMLRAYI